ncbi:hypothetical protein [Salinispora arenicola]|uniref:hypothetical protein n=1 Tax=Salinispora arenicola TaxID=168697 RepID=UPI0003603B14|nr:hypothetical protein [Salinispora arenicola]
MDETMLLIGSCVCCSTNVIGNPDTMPSVWVNTTTRCPIRTDGSQIVNGEPGTAREPVCPACAHRIRANDGRCLPVLKLFPHARVDLIHLEGKAQ